MPAENMPREQIPLDFEDSDKKRVHEEIVYKPNKKLDGDKKLEHEGQLAMNDLVGRSDYINVHGHGLTPEQEHDLEQQRIESLRKKIEKSTQENPDGEPF